MKKTLFLIFLFLLSFFRLVFIQKLNLKKNQVVKVTGILKEEPFFSGSRQIIKIGQFEAVVQRWPEYHYGDKVVLAGKITDGGKTDWLHKEKYFLKMLEIKKINDSNPPKLNLQKLAIKIREKIKEVFNLSFLSPHDGIMAGIVLGDDSLTPFSWQEKFKQSGTLHIMVASGSNIAMFTQGVLSLFCLIFVRKISLLILICLIWFYCLIAGFQPPIVRAAVMASLVYLSEFFGRKSEKKNILWLTGAVMLFFDPFLIADIGFQLSFLATAGLIYLQPVIKNGFKINFKKKNGKLKKAVIIISDLGKENFSSSLAAFLATAPVMLLNFGQINLFSPFINLAILWVVPYLLQSGMFLGILGLLGGLGLKTAQILALFLYPFLFYLEEAINLSISLF